MSERAQQMDHWNPLVGVLAVVLWITGIAIAESGGSPDENATAAEILTYFEENSTATLIGISLFSLGCISFIAFVAVLRNRLTGADQGEHVGVSLAFGAGLVTAAMMLAVGVPQVSLAIQTEDSAAGIEPATAQALWYAGDGFFVMAGFAGGLFLLAVAAVALRTAAFARWVAWLAVPVAIVMLIPPIGWAGLIFGFPVWLVIASIALVMHRLELPTMHTAAAAR